MPKMTLDSIVTSSGLQPLRVLVYGVPKVGKTTFGCSSERPVLLPLEDGAVALSVPRLPRPDTLPEVYEAFDLLLKQDHPYRTLVVDTVDWLEPLVIRQVCDAGNKGSLKEFGYGDGYELMVQEWRRVISRLERFRGKGLGVVAIAHAQIRPFVNPSGPDFDRWELKLHKRAAALWTEWADVLAFADHAVTVGKDDKPRGEAPRVLHLGGVSTAITGCRYPVKRKTVRLDWGEFKTEIEQSMAKEVSNVA